MSAISAVGNQPLVHASSKFAPAVVYDLFKLALLGLLLEIYACTVRDLAPLKTFQDAVAVRFRTAPPGIDFRNGAELVMSFEDAKFGAFDPQGLDQQALDVAEFSITQFPWPNELQSITIGYVKVDTIAGGITRTPYRIVRLRASQIALLRARTKS